MFDDCLSVEYAQQIRDAVKRKYRGFSREPNGQFPYPVGRQSLEQLGYSAEWIAAIPDQIVDRFVGVGNPFTIRRVRRGERVLDIGCGCGLDSFVAALQAGPEGLVIGVDLTAEMLEQASGAKPLTSRKNVEFQEASAEALPFEDASFDLVISNGVLNLVPDKRTAFREIARVLQPGGDFVAADLVVLEDIPETIAASLDAWST